MKPHTQFVFGFLLGLCLGVLLTLLLTARYVYQIQDEFELRRGDKWTGKVEVNYKGTTWVQLREVVKIETMPDGTVVTNTTR